MGTWTISAIWGGVRRFGAALQHVAGAADNGEPDPPGGSTADYPRTRCRIRSFAAVLRHLEATNTGAPDTPK